MKAFFKKILAFFDMSARDELSIYSAQASFFIMISSLPFIMLIVTLLQFITPITEADLLKVLIGITPDALHSFILSICEELFHKSAGTIISVTVISTIWSASKGVLGVEQGLSRIGGSMRNRNFLKRRLVCYFYTIVFIFLFIFSLGLLVFGNTIQMFLENVFPWLSHITGTIISLRTLLALAILVFFFTLMYTYLPDKKRDGTRSPFLAQLPGAIFSTAGWMLFSFFFSIYIDNFANYSYIYGSLTAIVLLMLWLYFCMYIIFLGAELNKELRLRS